MSNLLSKAPLYDVRGDFDYVATPVFYSTSLVLKRPSYVMRYADQAMSYIEPGKPNYANRTTVSVRIYCSIVSTNGGPNTILKSDHVLRVI